MLHIKRLEPDTKFDCIAMNQVLVSLHPAVGQFPVTREEFNAVLRNPLCHVLAAIDRGDDGIERYVGLATIFFQRNLMRWIAEIHDVVVHEHARGRGIGEALTKALLDVASDFCRSENVTIELSLTSRPSRIAANKLYQKLGFTIAAEAFGEHGTNFYKMIVQPK